MNVILIDDESAIRESVKLLLNMIAPQVKVIGEASSVAEGLALLKIIKPDILLLDIEMQDGTGFDLLSQIGDVSFPVIFVTAHNGFAIKAFKFSAVDYVLKPIDPDDLLLAMDKATKLINKEDINLKLNNAKEHFSNKNSNKIVLKDADSIHLLDIDEIVRCQSEDNYTKFILTDGRLILVSKTLKEYDKLLSERNFYRPHQSHLINLNHFSKFDKKEGGMIIMKNKDIVPVSVRKREGLFTAIERL